MGSSAIHIKERVCISGYAQVSSLGIGYDALRSSIFADTPPLQRFTINNDRSYPFAVLPAQYNNAGSDIHITLTAQCLEELSTRCGYPLSSLTAPDTALLMGITAGEHHRWLGDAPRHYRDVVNPAAFIESNLLGRLRSAFGFKGPGMAVNTACASTLSALVSGCRMLATGRVNKVLVGAIELLNWYDVTGFACAGLLADNACRPFDRRRNGLMLGEAAVFVLLEKIKDSREPAFEILSTGLSNECYDMAKPQPGGASLQACIAQALQAAGLKAADIDYINAHGTGTQQNDLGESLVYAAHWPAGECDTRISSTKGLHGHTRAAGGLLELLVCAAAIQEGMVPPNQGCEQPDDTCNWHCSTGSQQKNIRTALNIARGFGGNNVATIIHALV
jgi:3-oxoacyl-[acyl-carrier-protein] synthase I